MHADDKPTTLLELLADVAAAKKEHGIMLFVPTKIDEEAVRSLATGHELLTSAIKKERSNGSPACDEWVLLLEAYHGNMRTASIAYGGLRSQVPQTVVELCQKKLGPP